MESDEIADINLLLEADLDDLDDEASMDSRDAGDSAVLRLLVQADVEDAGVDDCDEATLLFMKESESLFVAHGEFTLLQLDALLPAHEELYQLPQEDGSAPSLEGVATARESSVVEESAADIAERRRIVTEVLQLMVGSVEALALVFARPTAIVDIPVEAISASPVAAIIEDDMPIPDVPGDGPADACTAAADLQRLKDQEKKHKMHNQMVDNNDELSVKMLFDEEKERLEADRRRRQERAARREATLLALKRESCAVRIQKTYRGSTRRREYVDRLQAHRGDQAHALQQQRQLMDRQAMQDEDALSACVRQLAMLEAAAAARAMVMAQEAAEAERIAREAERLRQEQEEADRKARERLEQEQKDREQAVAAALLAAQHQQSQPQAQPLVTASPATAIPAATPASVPIPAGVKGRTVEARKTSTAAPVPVADNGWGGVFSTSAWGPAPLPAEQEQVKEPDVEAEVDRIDEEDDQLPSEYAYESDVECWPEEHCVEADNSRIEEPAFPAQAVPVAVTGPISQITGLVLPDCPTIITDRIPAAGFYDRLYADNLLPAVIDFAIDEPLPSTAAPCADDELVAAWRQWQAGYQHVAVNAKGSGGSSASAEDSDSVKEITYSVEDLSDVDCIVQQYGKGLRKLTLNVNKLSNLSGIDALDGLQYLSLSDNHLTSIADLSSLRHLQHVNLDTNRISDLSVFHNHPSLQILSANCNNLQHFPNIHCQQLLRLDLYKNQIKHMPMEGVFNKLLSASMSSWHLPRLLYLNLGSNLLSQIDGHSLSGCVYLQTLILSHNKLRTLPSPLMLPCLTSLWLNGNQIDSWSPWVPSAGDEGIIYPMFLPQLQKLYLQDNCLKELQGTALRLLPMLSELDLSFNQIASMEGLRGLKDLSDAQRCCLNILKLNDNPLTSAALRIIPVLTAPAMQPSAAFSTPYGQQLYHEACLHDAMENSDWKGFAKLCLPALRWLSGEEVQQNRSAYRAGNTCKASESRQRLLQCLLHMKAETELVQHKVKKRILKAKGSAATPPADKLEEVQLSLAAMHCQRLFGLMEQQQQDMWMDFRETADLLPVMAAKAKEQDNSAELVQGISKLQGIYRGYAVRKRLKNIFGGIRYEDAELDDILQDDEDLLADLHLEDDHDLMSFTAPSKPMAYGDHIRMRRSRENLDTGKTAWGTTGTPAAGLPSDAMVMHSNANSRPQSSASSMSAVTEQSAAVDDRSTSSSQPVSARRPLAEEWGISDPRVMDALRKRNKRMKQFMTAAEDKEKEKDPQLRYERFVRVANNARHPHAKQPSVKRHAGGRTAPPAWLTPEF